MVEYFLKVKENKKAEPHAGMYKVYHATCPFCNYTCEIHAVDEMSVKEIYPRCHVCNKNLIKRDKKFKLK